MAPKIQVVREVKALALSSVAQVRFQHLKSKLAIVWTKETNFSGISMKTFQVLEMCPVYLIDGLRDS